jgi:glycosyltransferase involved in cell wall biosynthesis
MKVVQLIVDNRDANRTYGEKQPWFGTAPEALLQGFAQLPEVEVHVVGCTQRPMESPAKLAPNIYFHSVLVPKIGWMRTLYQGCVRATRRKLRELQPDIVHGQGTERDSALSAAFGGFPNVITIHGNMRLIAQVNRSKPFSFQWLAGRMESVAIPRSGGVVCITNYTREAVKSLARATWVLPNAVDESFFGLQPAPDPKLPPLILSVGVVGYRKNQNDFIRALDGLAARRPLRVVFMGKIEASAYGDEFRALVKARPWCEHVNFSGRDRVREYFQAASVVALPTREDNCPMVVLEAMAAGVPVFASQVGGVPDLIQDGVNGLFCDPLRPETFAECVSRLLDEPGLGRRLAETAKRQARERFHPTVVAQRHLEIYREVLGRSR